MYVSRISDDEDKMATDPDDDDDDDEEDSWTAMIWGLVIFIILSVYVCTPHDLVPVHRHGAVGLVDDATVLVLIFVLIATCMNSTITSAVVTMMVAIVGLIALSSPRNAAVGPYYYGPYGHAESM